MSFHVKPILQHKNMELSAKQHFLVTMALKDFEIKPHFTEDERKLITAYISRSDIHYIDSHALVGYFYDWKELNKKERIDPDRIAVFKKSIMNIVDKK